MKCDDSTQNLIFSIFCVFCNKYLPWVIEFQENQLIILIYIKLREKCPNTEFFLVRICPHSDWIRRDPEYLSVLSPNAGKYRPEKNYVFGHFSRSETLYNNANFIILDKLLGTQNTFEREGWKSLRNLAIQAIIQISRKCPLQKLSKVYYNSNSVTNILIIANWHCIDGYYWFCQYCQLANARHEIWIHHEVH